MLSSGLFGRRRGAGRDVAPDLLEVDVALVTGAGVALEALVDTRRTGRFVAIVVSRFVPAWFFGWLFTCFLASCAGCASRANIILPAAV